MKNNSNYSLFTDACVAVRIDTQEILFSGSGFYCDAMRTGNGGTPAVDPENVVVMTKENYDNLLLVQASHVGNP